MQLSSLLAGPTHFLWDFKTVVPAGYDASLWDSAHVPICSTVAGSPKSQLRHIQLYFI